MSQQDFVPPFQEPQGKGSKSLKKSQMRYSRAGKSKTGVMPKEEHPSTFEDTVPPYVYRAQDRPRETQERRHAESVHAREQSQRRFTPDGDALENGYRPYTRAASQQQRAYQSFSWMRPQRRNPRIWRWVLFIVLIIVALKALPLLFALLGIIAFTLLLPILLILGLVLAFVTVVFVALALIGVPISFGWFLSRLSRSRLSRH